MSRFNIRYYAMLREATGKASEEVQSNASTAAELYDELSSRYHFAMTSDYLKVSINEQIATWDRSIRDNDRIAFMPPFAGG